MDDGEPTDAAAREDWIASVGRIKRGEPPWDVG
jgi:hypothetical protein